MQAFFLAGEDLFGLFGGLFGAWETGYFRFLVNLLNGDFGLFATSFAFAFAHDCGIWVENWEFWCREVEILREIFLSKVLNIWRGKKLAETGLELESP